jgi:hypothetical protein
LLKKQMENYITDNTRDQKIALFEVEQDFAEKHQLLPSGVTVTEKDFHFRIIERCNKETEDVICTEDSAFLAESISYFKKQQNEFVYVESESLELVRIDAIALEFDDVFETYTVLFGLKLQKKFGSAIKAYLDAHLHGDAAKYSVMFSGEDGLWDVNFALDFAEGFSEDLSLEKVYALIYRFVFKLIEAIEEAQ